VWTDYPGSPTSGGLVNDLDLEVIGPGGTRYYGNGAAWDRINNVEGVDVLNPAPGTYTITVHAHNVAQDTQPYALVVSSALGDANCKTLNSATLQAPALAGVNHSVPFTATVIPPTATWPVHYAWAFGDGLEDGGIVPTTTHIYATPGLYTAVVTASNCGGTAFYTGSAVVEVACTGLSGVRASADDPVMLGSPLHFQTTLTPTQATQPISYTWDFGAAGDGSGLDSPSPVFTYTEPGMHLVAVAASNCAGAGQVFDALQVQVYNALVYLPLVLKSPS
jgi:PKD repeat protein